MIPDRERIAQLERHMAEMMANQVTLLELQRQQSMLLEFVLKAVGVPIEVKPPKVALVSSTDIEACADGVAITNGPSLAVRATMRRVK